MCEWLVIRQDDNGNRYIVARFPSRDAAEREAARLEESAHEQMYWVEPTIVN